MVNKKLFAGLSKVAIATLISSTLGGVVYTKMEISTI